MDEIEKRNCLHILGLIAAQTSKAKPVIRRTGLRAGQPVFTIELSQGELSLLDYLLRKAAE